MKTGKILAIIGIILSVLYLLLIVGMISMFGWYSLQDQEIMQERIRELMGQ